MPTRPRILLADDHPSVAKALERLLSVDCDVVGVVADGGDLVETAARLQPVVVVADLNLPNVSGLEACRRIVKTNPRAKVILITGMMDESIRAIALAAGASSFLPKLAVGDELMDAVRRAWEDAP
jgi:DNA-binding NarL/FixJ family response regulator